MSRLRRLLGRTLRAGSFEQELDEEIRSHIEMHVDELVARGMVRVDAEKEARIAFGGTVAVKEECREAAPLAWMHAMQRDVRLGFRRLRKSPGFAAVSIATLALCIGANTAVFNLVDTVFFRALPYPDSDRLGRIETVVSRADGESVEAVNGATWESIRGRVPGLDMAVAAGWTGGVNVVAGDRAEYVMQQRVSAGYWRVLGVHPVSGREFTEEEDVPGGPRVAMISHDLRKRTFDEESDVVGRGLRLKGEEYVIVGVMPPRLQSVVNADVWTPLQPSREGEGAGENYTVLARLADGTSWREIADRVRVLGESVLPVAADESRKLRIIPLRRAVFGDVQRSVSVMWAGVVLVLLIGCVNLGGLILSRATGRSREIATRLAIGGSRKAIVRQLFAEGCTIALCGGVAGAGVGVGLLRLLIHNSKGALDFPVVPSPDLRMLAATAGFSIIACIVFSIYPAVLVSGVQVSEALGESGPRTTPGRERTGLRRSLVVSQIALAVVLLACAALLARSFGALRGLESGVAANGLTAATVSLDDARYRDSASANSLFRETLRAIESHPGVDAAGVALTLPYQRPLNMGFRVAGAPEGSGRTMNLIYATPGYLEVLRVPLFAGRSLRDSDDARSQPVVVASRTFVRRYLGRDDAVGIHLTFAGRDWEIVGVVGDVAQRPGFGDFGPVAAMPCLYTTPAQIPDDLVALVHGWFAPSWVVRGTEPVEVVASVIRGEVARYDGALPVAAIHTIDELSRTTLARERFEAQLMGSTALVALFLAAIGLAGLMASSVEERRRELGIRMALGASKWRALRTAVAPCLALTVSGLLLGGLFTVPATRALRGMLWGVGVTDPSALSGVVIILFTVAIGASVGPAVGVLRLDPTRVLRDS